MAQMALVDARDLPAGIRSGFGGRDDEVPIRVDDNGIIVYWSPGASSVYGVLPENALGRELHLVIAAGPARGRDAAPGQLPALRRRSSPRPPFSPPVRPIPLSTSPRTPDLEPGAVPEAALSGAVTLPRNGAAGGERNGGAGTAREAPPGHVTHLPGVRKRDSVEFSPPSVLILATAASGASPTQIPASAGSPHALKQDCPRWSDDGDSMRTIHLAEAAEEEYEEIGNPDAIGFGVWTLATKRHKNGTESLVVQSNEVERLVAANAQVDLCDTRFVIWRTTFIAMIKALCGQMFAEEGGKDSQRKQGHFTYDFSFEATNGHVSWYKVESHVYLERNVAKGFVVEITGDHVHRVELDRWQMWWTKMCHLVFDATLLVDSQEYLVLNAWGEKDIFGQRIPKGFPLMLLVYQEDQDRLREAFNMATIKSAVRRELNLRRPRDKFRFSARLFFLAADKEDPSLCMVGIRLQKKTRAALLTQRNKERRAEAAPAPATSPKLRAEGKKGLDFLTTEVIGRDVSSVNIMIPRRSSGTRKGWSSSSLDSIPEENDEEFMALSETNSHSSGASESNVPASSDGNEDWSDEDETASQPSSSSSWDSGRRNSPRRSPEPPRPAPVPRWVLPQKPAVKLPPNETRRVTLKWAKQQWDLVLQDFTSVREFKSHIHELTQVPPARQKLLGLVKGTILQNDADWAAMVEEAPAQQSVILVGTAVPNSFDPALREAEEEALAEEEEDQEEDAKSDRSGSTDARSASDHAQDGDFETDGQDDACCGDLDAAEQSPDSTEDN